jgi:ubiquinone/menaquinone biosynthesis C-methylase UbiE
MEVFDQLAQLYQGEHSQNPFQNARVEALGALLPAGSSVLDLGCGTGVPTARILTGSGHRVLGVDVSEGMLRLAREQVPAAEFRRADVRDLPADLGPFDAVTSFFALLMLSRADIDLVLRKVVGWLRPGGHFAVGMVNFDGDSVPLEFLGVPVSISGYPEAEWKDKLREAGLTVLEIETVEFTPENGPPESQIYALCRKD